MQQLTVQHVFDTMCEGLGVRWVTGLEGGNRVLTRDMEPSIRPSLIGPFNVNIPNRVQILGRAETTLLNASSLEANRIDINGLLHPQCDLIIVTDGNELPDVMSALSEQQNIPVFIAECSYNDCLNTLRHRLTQFLAERSVLHGVLMDVLGTGVLITGESGVGKSELALELISRGHILVADDSPEFKRIAPDTLEGSCPPLLQDFLEVRGLGILNIAQMYGHAQTRKRKILKFIIKLQAMKTEELNQNLDRASDIHTEKEILGVVIREQIIPVAPGRNLAVLVEAAVRNHILTRAGYSANDDFIGKQKAAIALPDDAGMDQ